MFLRLKYYTFNKNIPFLSRQLFTFTKDSKIMEKEIPNQIEVKQNAQDAIQPEPVVNPSSRENNKTFKAKVGLFFGYNGQKYLGMQYQRDTENTIENTIHRIMIEDGFILKTNQDELKRIRWSRAARTDKKVHALCNGISAKLEISDKFISKEGDRDIDFDKLRNHFNSQLPMDIRIFSIMRVAKSFDMRHDALTRVYNYIIPLYIFQKYEDFKSGKIPSAEQEIQIVEKLNSLCKCYLGTRNYHNFTKGYKQNDPKCERYMLSMKAESVEKEVFERYWQLHNEDSQKRDVSKQRYIRFTLIGQSFIYHQIRKMIGLIVKIFAEGLEDGESTIKQAFKPGKIDLYLAPGEGLYLNRMTFQAYNKRRHSNNEKAVILSQQDEERILRFRQYLESQILHHEIEQKVFTLWITNKFEYQGSENEDEEVEVSMQQEEGDNKGQKREDQAEGQVKESYKQKSKNYKKQFNKRK